MGKFHGTMIPTTPRGSWKVTSTPPATGIWRPRVALGRRRVVLEHVADVAGLPPGVGDDVAGVGHLQPGQLLEVGVDQVGEAPQEPGPVARGDRPPGRPAAAAARATAASTSGPVGRRHRGDDLAGRRVEHRDPGAGGAHPPIMARPLPGPRQSRGPGGRSGPGGRLACARALLNRRRPDRPTRLQPPSAFETVAGAVADRECLVWRDRRLTYAQVAERSRRLASYLHDAGAGRPHRAGALAGHESGQDHVALALYNGNEYLEGMLGAYRARVAPFNVNYRYVGEELRYLLERRRAPAAVIYHASLAPILAEVLADLPTCRRPAPGGRRVGPSRSCPGPSTTRRPWPPPRPAGRRPGPRPTTSTSSTPGARPGCPRACCGASTTSSWRPWAGAAWAPGRSVASYEALAAQASAGPGLRLMLLPPLMHGAAQWAAFMMMADGAVIVLPTTRARMDPADVWRTVERERANTMTVVGDAMLRPLLERARPGPLRHLVARRHRQRRGPPHPGRPGAGAGAGCPRLILATRPARRRPAPR